MPGLQSPNAYPRTIDNGAGERLTFTRRTHGEAAERLELETVVAPNAGPLMHVHYLQTEALTVVQGRIGYQRPGEPPSFAGPGDTVVFGPGEPHKFWNAGSDELRCTGYVEPPCNAEYLLSAVFESQRRRGGKQPHPLDAAFLVRRYSDEFGLVEIPGAVQRLVFPLMIAVGTLVGRYRKYAAAPPPVQRVRGS